MKQVFCAIAMRVRQRPSMLAKAIFHPQHFIAESRYFLERLIQMKPGTIIFIGSLVHNGFLSLVIRERR